MELKKIRYICQKITHFPIFFRILYVHSTLQLELKNVNSYYTTNGISSVVANDVKILQIMRLGLIALDAYNVPNQMSRK